MKNSTITFSTDKIIVVLESFINTCDVQLSSVETDEGTSILSGAIEIAVQMIEALKFGDNPFHVYYNFHSLLPVHKHESQQHKIGYTRALRVLLNSLQQLSKAS